MTSEEFAALPATVQIRCLLEAFPAIEKALAALECPRPPARPKYDERIRRKGGFQWASETSLEALRFFHARAMTGGNEAYAERNLRESSALARWMQWREYHPTAIWDGERARVKVTANPPSDRPELHAWEVRNAPNSGGTTGERSNSAATDINFRALDGEDSDEDFEEEKLANGF